MEIDVCRHALDRVPLSLIIDDSTPLVNLNYFFLRDRNAHRNERQRWEDVPVATPESFTREWATWCREAGVRGKFSVVPNPAALGRIDQGLALFGSAQLESWLSMCRETIVPSFDITPEMLTHTFVLDLQTQRPLTSRIWEQYEWSLFTEADRVDDYIAQACQILVNVGLPPQGVTSPGGFGHRCLDLYARMTGEALRRVTDNPTPFFFQRLVLESNQIDTPVWYPDRATGTAVGEVIACTDDYTGSWTGYGDVDAAYYIDQDLQVGRLPGVIDAGSPCIICSHWQGMYGLHDDDRRGFRTLQTVVERLRQRDPAGEQTRWRTCSEIANYACCRELLDIAIEGTTSTLHLPIRVPELTLRLSGIVPGGIAIDGRPLREVSTRRAFADGTFYREGSTTLLAFTPPEGPGPVTLTVQAA